MSRHFVPAHMLCPFDTGRLSQEKAESWARQTKRAAKYGGPSIQCVSLSLTLGELEALAGLGAAELLAFHHAAVTGQEPGGLQRGA